jgi:hypothetical protein
VLPNDDQETLDSLNVRETRFRTKYDDLKARFSSSMAQSDFTELMTEFDALISNQEQLAQDWGTLKTKVENLIPSAYNSEWNALNTRFTDSQRNYEYTLARLDPLWALSKNRLSSVSRFAHVDSTLDEYKSQGSLLNREYASLTPRKVPTISLADFKTLNAEFSTLVEKYEQLEQNLNQLYRLVSSQARSEYQQAITSLWTAYEAEEDKYDQLVADWDTWWSANKGRPVFNQDPIDNDLVEYYILTWDNIPRERDGDTVKGLGPRAGRGTAAGNKNKAAYARKKQEYSRRSSTMSTEDLVQLISEVSALTEELKAIIASLEEIIAIIKSY